MLGPGELAHLEVAALAEQVQIIRIPVRYVVIGVVYFQAYPGRLPIADQAMLAVPGGNEAVG